MRQPFLFLDRGDGWENLTGHQGDVVTLSAFDIDWGTDDPTKQPDVSVLSFRLLDRTGALAGNSTRLAGAKVLVQLTLMPQWRDLNSATMWRDQRRDWAHWHLEHIPNPTGPMDPTALTIFRGTMATGNTITQNADGSWTLDLHANGDLVRASRTTEQGPTSSDPKYAGMHWTGWTTDRIAEVQRRLTALGCPPLSAATMDWLTRTRVKLAPYDSDSFPDLSTVLYHLGAHHPDLPLYYETHEHGRDETTAWLAGVASSITLHSDGSLTAEGGNGTESVLTGDQIGVDATQLTLPDPISQVTIKGKRVKWDESGSKLTFEDAQLTIGGRGRLPANLTQTVKSATFESDAVIEDASEGHWDGNVWQPTDAQRDQWAEWLRACTMRLRPEKLTVSTRKVDIDQHEQNLQPSPALYGFIRNRYTPLLSDDGTPATSGVWLAIGGTLSFDWEHGEPILSNKLTLWPMPTIPPTLSSWADLKPITLAWQSLAFTWGELGQITYFRQ